MRILSLEKEPFHAISFASAGGQGKVDRVFLPFYRATVDVLPDGVAAIAAMSDLQGREIGSLDPGTPRLLGQVVAEELWLLSENRELPPSHQTGIILAGDLFTGASLDKRGEEGNVETVWEAFADGFPWVAGVAGNHDLFDNPDFDTQAFSMHPYSNIFVLNKSVTDIGGFRIGGVSGIVGNPKKPFRREEQSFLDALKDVIQKRPDLLVLHQNTDIQIAGRSIVDHLEQFSLEMNTRPLVICGHHHWENPLFTTRRGLQILNVDSAVSILNLDCPCRS